MNLAPQIPRRKADPVTASRRRQPVAAMQLHRPEAIVATWGSLLEVAEPPVQQKSKLDRRQIPLRRDSRPARDARDNNPPRVTEFTEALAPPSSNAVPARSLIATPARMHQLRDRLLRNAHRRWPCALGVGCLQAAHDPEKVLLPLAMSLRELSREKVVLWDLAGWQPEMYARLGVSPRQGWTDWLARERRCDEVVAPTCVPGLFVLPKGRVDLPGHVAAADLWRARCAELHGRYPGLIVDAGPLVDWPRLPSLAFLCDAIYLVVSLADTRRKEVRQAESLLRQWLLELDGYILTDAFPSGLAQSA